MSETALDALKLQAVANVVKKRLASAGADARDRSEATHTLVESRLTFNEQRQSRRESLMMRALANVLGRRLKGMGDSVKDEIMTEVRAMVGDEHQQQQRQRTFKIRHSDGTESVVTELPPDADDAQDILESPPLFDQRKA